MGAPFSKHHQVPYGYQSNQQQTQPSQQRVNSFPQDQGNSVPHTNTAMLLDQNQKLLNTNKKQAHQVNEVQVATPQVNTTWDLNTASELPQGQEDESE